MDKRQEIGKLGEQVARKYLLENEYDIIEKNYRCNYGEIDIIAYDKPKEKRTLVFIEVKTRSNELFGEGIEAIDITKQKHIYKTAEYYLHTRNKENNNIRIDGIEVFLNADKVTLKHYYNIIMENPHHKKR